MSGNLKPKWVEEFGKQLRKQSALTPVVVVAPCPLEHTKRGPSSSAEVSRLRGSHNFKLNQAMRKKLDAALDFTFPEDEL